MKNTVSLVVIIIIIFSSSIYPQQKYRKMIYLNQSIGGHIYYEGVITNVPAEVDSYNVKNSLTGEEAVSITKYPDDDYPPGGNQMWKWQKAFYDSAGFSFKEDFLEDSTYSVIMVKFCAASQSAIWFYWYEGPQDTVNFPETQSYYNYQWYIRKIVRKMEEYPDKFFVLWNIPSATEEEGTPDDMYRLSQFNQWMTDSLATGLDTQIGDFPPNIFVFDYFNLLKSPYSNYMDSIYRDAPNDYHPNAAASEVVAPELVEQAFNAAINYEATIPVELLSFSASIISAGVELNWSTATELNNYGFEIQRKAYNEEYNPIGFVNGYGTTTNKNNYIFIDKTASSGKYLYRLKQLDFDGDYNYSSELEVNFSSISVYAIEQNYPNPFNPTTEIKFSLAKSENVKLIIYDISGSEIDTLIDGFMNEGNHSIIFNASGLKSGVYFYRLKTDNFISTRKMLLLK